MAVHQYHVTVVADSHLGVRTASSTTGLWASDGDGAAAEVSSGEGEDECSLSVSRALAEALYEHGPVVSPLGSERWDLRFVVQAASPAAAGSKAESLTAWAATCADLAGWRVVSLSVKDDAAARRDFDDATGGGLLGVAELADLLGVSRQRASQLARDPRFPEPAARLSAGPVFNKAIVERHIQNRDRLKSSPDMEG